MKILLTGATGFIGKNLSLALTQAGHTIVAVSRQHGLNAVQMLTAKDWLPLLEGVDVVINAMGIIAPTTHQSFEALHSLAPMALFEACQIRRVHRIIQISALGCTADAFSGYHRSKWLADQALRRSDLNWFILRPSLIYGRDGVSAKWLMRLARCPVLPIISKKEPFIQPVHIRDVVTTVMQCLTDTRTCQTLDMASTKAWTLSEWLSEMRQAQGLSPAWHWQVPWPLVRVAFELGQYALPMLHPDNLHMLLNNKMVDVQAWIDFLGHPPTPHHPDLFFCNTDAKGDAS